LTVVTDVAFIITKHFVESEGDLDVLLYLLQHRRLEPANLDDWSERSEVWRAYDGLPCIGLPRSPLASLFVEWAGVENATYLIMDCPDKIEEMRDLADSDTVIFWGGVPGVMFAPPFTWDQMKAHVLRLIACWGNRPFIMGVADQVPPDGDIDFCRKIAELVSP